MPEDADAQPAASPSSDDRRPTDRRRRLWRLLAPVLRPERRTLAGITLLLVLAIGPDVAAPLVVRRIFDQALPAGDGRGLLLLTAAVAGLALAGQGLRYAQGLLAVAQRGRIRYRLARRVLRHLLRLPYAFHLEHDSRLLSSRLRDDLAALDGLMPDAVAGAGVDVVRGAVFTVLLFHLDPVLAAAGLLLMVLLVGGFAASSSLLRRHSRRALDGESDAAAAFLDSLAGLLTVRTTAQEAREGRRVARHLATAERRKAERDAWGKTVGGAIGVVGRLGVYLVVALGAWRVMTGGATVGTLFSFFLILDQTVGAAAMVAILNPEWQRALAALDRIDELMARPAERWRGHRGPGRIAAGRRQAIRGEVRLQDVWLSYGAGEPVLQGVSLTLRPGELVALVGPSGAGKSSLALLVPALLEPTEGRLLLDGRPYAEWPLETVRRHVGYVPQEVFLFRRSVRDNLAFARPDADPEALRRAARGAAAEGFIDALPAGWETALGERGTGLSGGQRQRLALARELLRETPVLVLDEATSALDAASEAAVRGSLDELRRDRACLVVAHRLSTVRDADRIVVLDRGRIVDQGSHAELHARCELYRRLCRLQLLDAAGAGEASARVLTIVSPPADRAGRGGRRGRRTRRELPRRWPRPRPKAAARSPGPGGRCEGGRWPRAAGRLARPTGGPPRGGPALRDRGTAAAR